MCSHICALKHLSESTESPDNALDELEGGLCALTEGLGQTLAIGTAHGASHAAVHATHAAHASHTTHTTIWTSTVHASSSIHATSVHASAIARSIARVR
jgi:hypothetical protein